jgi:hypothetical protein
VKNAIWPSSSSESGSKNRYVDFAQRLAALGICDSSVNVGSDCSIGGEDNQKRKKREVSQANKIANGFHNQCAAVC